MSRPVYSFRFGVWQHQTGTVSVENTGPDTWIIRQVTVWNGNLAEVNTFALGDLSTGAVLLHYNEGSSPGQWFFSWEGRLVIPPGEGNGFIWESGGFPVDVSVQGYVLTPP